MEINIPKKEIIQIIDKGNLIEVERDVIRTTEEIPLRPNWTTFLNKRDGIAELVIIFDTPLLFAQKREIAELVEKKTKGVICFNDYIERVIRHQNELSVFKGLDSDSVIVTTGNFEYMLDGLPHKPAVSYMFGKTYLRIPLIRKNKIVLSDAQIKLIEEKLPELQRLMAGAVNNYEQINNYYYIVEEELSNPSPSRRVLEIALKTISLLAGSAEIASFVLQLLGVL